MVRPSKKEIGMKGVIVMEDNATTEETVSVLAEIQRRGLKVISNEGGEIKVETSKSFSQVNPLIFETMGEIQSFNFEE